MDEKIMLEDIISDLKFNINLYQIAILECENIQLRQILQQMRNMNESLQYELNKILKIKGYAIYSEKATAQQVDEIKQQIQTENGENKRK